MIIKTIPLFETSFEYNEMKAYKVLSTPKHNSTVNAINSLFESLEKKQWMRTFSTKSIPFWRNIFETQWLLQKSEFLHLEWREHKNYEELMEFFLYKLKCEWSASSAEWNWWFYFKMILQWKERTSWHNRLQVNLWIQLQNFKFVL